MQPEQKKVTFEEFMAMDRSDIRMEYFNGEIYYQASPSVAHQSIVTKLAVELGLYFRGKECQLFVAPLDIIFQNEAEKHVSQPDLTIICDKKGFTENSYTGIPTIVIEVLSPSTSSIDYITKMNIYMKFGVKEYWIVSPKNKTIEVFVLEDGVYGEPIIYMINGIVKSTVFTDLEIDLANIFS